jgi:hypothetical protein
MGSDTGKTMRTPIIVIEKWIEKTKSECRYKFSIITRILLFFHLVSRPVIEYYYFIEITIRKGDDLRKGGTILLHNSHESAWMCMDGKDCEFKIASHNPIANMLPYTGPAIIISNAFSEFNKDET